MTCRTEYEKRLQARQHAHALLRKRDDRAVHFRTAIFGLGLACAWAVLGSWQLSAAVLVVPVGLFIAAVLVHESVRRRERTAAQNVNYYERCVRRLDGAWAGTGPDGLGFSVPQHPYAADLDIFGTGSLFQLVGSPVTPAGAACLAEWLAPHSDALAALDTVATRQQAVASLRDQLDLRERLAGIDPHSPATASDGDRLQQWLEQAGGLSAVWIRLAASLLGVLGVATLVAWFVTHSSAAVVLIVLMQLTFVHRLRRPLESIKKSSERALVELQCIEKVLAALETVAGEDPQVCRLRGELIHDGTCASEVIHRLERQVSQFENMRRNVMIAPFAFLAMANVQFACAIDRWRASYGPHVSRWFQAVGELEALLALAQLHYENPDYCFPKLVKEGPEFSATGFAHPLLPPGTAVTNDIELSKNCRVLLVSGSNMSGKSTLLRAVGINTALAWAGAPVCAQSLTLSRLQTATAMRVQDSLQTGTSHFLAELHRIRLIVELAQQKCVGSAPVLFLLDEILHGTNSHDRLVGARGILRSLVGSGAIGLVTTHDLALSAIVTELDDQPSVTGNVKAKARNVHFRDQWHEGTMTFDYQMREGVVPKSNALSLMRLLGMDV